jgi:predicted metalloprotease with PDZ domain
VPKDDRVTEPIRYTVDLADRDHHLVRVSMHVPAALARGARLVLPVWTPGSYLVRNYARHVQWIRASSDGAEVAVTPDGVSAWIVDGDGTSAVTVTLELYANEPTVRTNHVDDHHALLVPAATFPYLDGATDRPCEVTIPPVPDDHRVFSLLPPTAQAHTFRADDRDHLVDSAFEIGELPSVRW